MKPRRPDWLARLHAYLASCQRKPFLNGEHDCALFAAGAIEAMTGDDLAAEYRGRYDDLQSGVRLVAASGFNGPIDLLKAHAEMIPISKANVGDIAVLRTPEGPALGVVQGARVFYASKDGLLTVDLLDASSAFRIPMSEAS